MLFNVPQFINIEDKIVGPLTAKQLGWIAMGGVILLVLFVFLDQSAFIIAAVIIAIIFGALAFYRPYNQPLINFIGSSISFVFRPRLYVWKRLGENMKSVRKTDNRPAPIAKKKILNSQHIEEISKRLNSLNH
jgi:hypothetical protein